MQPGIESSLKIREMTDRDRSEVSELIYISINHWYQMHGRPPIFHGDPQATEVFYDVYAMLDPGCAVVAENTRTGRLMASCFFHPRERHVSLGIMNVHPNYFGQGAGKALLRFIIDYTEQHGFPALRLTQSALNLDSFSLYNTAGFVPRCTFQDMFLTVPKTGMKFRVAELDRVREATLADVPAMISLELEVSGIMRERDYCYCIENHQGIWHVSVYESNDGGIGGFMISCVHPAMNMLGPCVARGEQEAAALILRELDHYKGRTPLFLLPVEKAALVRLAYDWGARNCELHLCQVRGEFQPFRGISMPSFLPESG
ncbi:MAG TPA: GNAT family N-acetyltransferase [Bryobacteraceae bacterium]|nr:GNAT family N-acetyltransferase [Bryobacteraceae bacterium]